MEQRGGSASPEPSHPEGLYQGRGSGEVSPDSGLPRWIDRPTGGPRWLELLSWWTAIEADFQDTYGIDLEGGVLDTRTGRWLRVRILGLLVRESRLRTIIFPPKKGGP